MFFFIECLYNYGSATEFLQNVLTSFKYTESFKVLHQGDNNKMTD